MTPPSELNELPTSCEVVWRVLAEDAPLTVSEISHRTTCSHRTIERAVKRLYESDVIERYPTNDGRSPAYALAYPRQTDA